MTNFPGKKGFVNSVLQYAPPLLLVLSASYLTGVIANPYRPPERQLLLGSAEETTDDFTQLSNSSEVNTTDNSTLFNLTEAPAENESIEGLNKTIKVPTNDTNASLKENQTVEISPINETSVTALENITNESVPVVQPVEEPIEVEESFSGEPVGLLDGATNHRISSISAREIKILQQDYIDSYFTWDFQEINNTHWKATFTIDEGFWNDAKNCNSKDDATKLECFRNFRGRYFPKMVADDAVKLEADIANMGAYPLANLTPNIRFSNFNINFENGTGSFYLIFPRGFMAGERAKFGFNSTVIYSTLGETEPFTASGRAICRTTNAIHVVAVNGTTGVFYFRSTDNGATWSMTKLDGSGTLDNPVATSEAAIACSGTKVFVIWNGGTTNSSLFYRNSTDEGATWNPLNISNNVATQWFSGTSASNRAGPYVSAEFGVGDNIWVAWQYDGGTPENLTVDNSTVYGGDLPTITRTSMKVDLNTWASPQLLVNISGSTEEVYVPYFRPSNSDIEINYTTNGGTTWRGTSIHAGTFLPGNLSGVILNNAIYVVYTSSTQVLIKNSTDRGATWSSATTIATETPSDPTIATDGNGLWVFWNNGTANTNSNNVRYATWTSTSGWSSASTWKQVNSYVRTRPNAKFNGSGCGIELVYINRTASSGNIDLNYDCWHPTITFSNPQNNNSNAKPNDPVNFSIQVSTDYGCLSDYIFSQNFSNPGVWTNSSWIPIGGCVQTATIWNASYTTDTPNVYGWKFYVKVSYMGYTSNSTDQQFNFSTRILQTTWHTGSLVNSTACSEANPCQYTQNQNFTANATVQCSTIPAGLSCGSVTGSIRYNSSGVTPDALISTTPGATPFFADANPASCGSLSDGNSCTLSWKVNVSGTGPQIRALDVNFSSDQPGVSENDTPDAYISIPGAVVGFTITLPAQDPVYAAEGGNATADIEFNLTGGNTASNVVPCIASTLTCQNDGIPIFQFTNTGTTTLSWYIYLSSSLPASITLKGDTDNNPGGATQITTSGWLVAAVAPSNSQNAWLWADFNGASVSDATSRYLINNATSS